MRLKYSKLFFITVFLALFFQLYFAKVYHILPESSNKELKEISNMAYADSQKYKAPQFPRRLEWLNTVKPLKLDELTGKIVLLDFWTLCCINCIHVLNDLKKLESEFKDNLIVIGVHTPKFKYETSTESIRQAILRYEIRHPVVNDIHRRIWAMYGVHAWPTLVLIDPEGYIVGTVTGEGNYTVLKKAILATIDKFKPAGRLNITPYTPQLEMYPSHTTLLFPAKTIVDEKTKRLFIADTNHNRILITTLNGVILDYAGNAEIGLADGSFEQAQFNHPQGMALAGDCLYVADTNNHLIRRLDLRNRTVETIAGNATQGVPFTKPADPLSTALNSPWDIAYRENALYIAMAGANQIWRLSIPDNRLDLFAGNGTENITDGLLQSASMAQPSAITYLNSSFYVADSETSSIRKLDISDNDAQMRTVIGDGLFIFGDHDGKGDEVRLQHPQGITSYNGKLIVADTYNHKIKLIDPLTRTSETLFGTGNPGLKDGKTAEFFEPSGVSITGDTLYIADTNNHKIRIASLSDKTVTTLKLKNITFPPDKTVYNSQPLLIALSGGKIMMRIYIPDYIHIPDGTQIRYTITASPDSCIFIQDKLKSGNIPLAKKRLAVPYSINQDSITISDTIIVNLDFIYCVQGKNSACRQQKVIFRQPVGLDANSTHKNIYFEFKF